MGRDIVPCVQVSRTDRITHSHTTEFCIRGTRLSAEPTSFVSHLRFPISVCYRACFSPHNAQQFSHRFHVATGGSLAFGSVFERKDDYTVAILIACWHWFFALPAAFVAELQRQFHISYSNAIIRNARTGSLIKIHKNRNFNVQLCLHS